MILSTLFIEFTSNDKELCDEFNFETTDADDTRPLSPARKKKKRRVFSESSDDDENGCEVTGMYLLVRSVLSP